jgi:V-type H+-transporting ATPase subunit C
MSGSTKYLLVSLPTSISQSNEKEDAFATLQATVSTDNGTVMPFKIPEFKIGTLDALVQQAEDLAKLETICRTTVAKVGDSLRTLLEGDEQRIAQQKTVNDSTSTTASKTSYKLPSPMTNVSKQSLLINTCEHLLGIKSSTAPINL